jgi:hypothetical protein
LDEPTGIFPAATSIDLFSKWHRRATVSTEILPAQWTVRACLLRANRQQF